MADVVQDAKDAPVASYTIGTEYIPQEGDGKMKPTKWEMFLAGENVCCFYQTKAAPCCACWFFFLIGYVFVGAFGAKAYMVGSDIFSFEPGTITSNIVVQREYGFKAAQRNIDEGCDRFNQKEELCEAEDKCMYDKDRANRRGQLGICKEKEPCGSAKKPRESLMDVFFFVYEATTPEQNILEDKQLKRIYDFETRLLSDANGAKEPWTEYCMRIYSNDTAWSCAPPTSMMNLMTMTSKGRKAVGDSADAMWSCACSPAAGQCPMCNADGTGKSMNAMAMNTQFTTCMVPVLTAQAAAAANVDPNCSTGRGGGGGAAAAGWDGICGMMPSCQWSGPGFSFCTSTKYFYPLENAGLVSGAEKDAYIDAMCDESKTLFVSQRKQIFGESFDCNAKKSRYARTVYFSGALKGDKKERDDFETNYIKATGGWYEMQRKLESEIERESNGELRIMMLATPVFFSQMLSLLQTDGLLSIVSLVTVWLYMWFAMESMFLATCGIFEILFSLPVALSLWTVIANQKITGLQVLVVYMILGIGADDVFILYDAWLQSAQQNSKISDHWVTRFCWAYRRAFSAMLITTCTTCGSFAIGATSPLPEVRMFCLFAAVVVLVDYLFCVSFFASAIVVYERYMKGYACCSCCGMLLAAPGRVCGPGCCWGTCRAALSLGGTSWKLVDKPVGKGEIATKRALERFAGGTLYNFLAGTGGKVLLVFWVLLTIGMGASAGVQLRTAQEAPQLGRDSTDATKILEVMLDNFANFRQPVAYAVFGLKMDDPVVYGDTREEDKAVYAGAPDISTPAGQVKVLNLCRAPDKGNGNMHTRCNDKTCLVLGSSQPSGCARDEALWRTTGIYAPAVATCDPGRHCYMEEFARWWAQNFGNCKGKAQLACTGDCLWAATEQVCYSSKTEFDYVGLPETEFLDKLRGAEFAAYKDKRKRLLSLEGRRDLAMNYEKMTGVKMGVNRIDFAYVGYNATYPIRNTADQANEWHTRWEEFYKTNAGGLTGYLTTDLYLFMTTQNEMVKSAVLGVCLSLLISTLVMLIATMNWRTTILGSINLVVITTCFLGIMPLLGWSLGEYECIFTIAAVGLSVDYTLHLLHAYNHSEHTKRHERAQAAMSEMGISVISSALTTLFAASMLFYCQFMFFFQFGGFIFIVILLSIVLSVFFLIPLMVVLGPEDEQGKIPTPNIKFFKKSE